MVYSKTRKNCSWIFRCGIIMVMFFVWLGGFFVLFCFTFYLEIISNLQKICKNKYYKDHIYPFTQFAYC